MENPAAVALNDLLITKNFEPEAKDARGLDVEDPADAKMFSFDWTTENKNYGTVVVLLSEDGSLTMYFGDNLGRTMESDDKKEWYAFLEQMKTFAVRNKFKNFSLDNISRLKYTMQGMAAIKEGLFEGYYGKKNISYSDQPKQVRLMIKHSRDIQEGEARYRAIESLFVETADGERFRVPSRSLMHGRMLARHCAEGGTPHDTFGNYINEMISEMATLARFVRAAKHREFSGEAATLVETAIRHYTDLKAKAKHMISQRGYHEARETFDPAVINDSSEVAESIRGLFVEQTLDSRIEEALPILAKLKEPNMREADEFESWANKVMEGTWALPDSPDTERQLKDLMSKPLIVGADATNATEQLYDLVGDDMLFDRLGDLADRDPNANCWEDPGVIDRLGELGIDINPTTGPDANKQGMTEGSGSLDYDKILNAIAALYGPEIWDNDAMQDLANDLEQAGPTDRELDFIIAKGKLPRRLANTQFTNNDNVQFSEQGVAEGHEDSAVASALTRRIMSQRLDLLKMYGPVKVMAAIDDAAEFFGDVEEIGSSDMHAYMQYVEKALSGMAEGLAGAALGGLAGAALTKSPGGAMTGASIGSNIQDTLSEDLQADDGEYYENADDFFGQFEADSFDNEEQSEDGMEVRGYIDGVNVMVFQYDSPEMTSGYGIYDDSALNQDLAEGTRQGIMLNGKEVDMRSLEIENVDARDYPDFSDAYIGRASFTDGTDLSDQEMDQLNDEHGDLVHELAYDSLHESDLGEDLDTDGVMMTRPSNMSSESVEQDSLSRILTLAKGY